MPALMDGLERLARSLFVNQAVKNMVNVCLLDCVAAQRVGLDPSVMSQCVQDKQMLAQAMASVLHLIPVTVTKGGKALIAAPQSVWLTATAKESALLLIHVIATKDLSVMSAASRSVHLIALDTGGAIKKLECATAPRDGKVLDARRQCAKRAAEHMESVSVQTGADVSAPQISPAPAKTKLNNAGTVSTARSSQNVPISAVDTARATLEYAAASLDGANTTALCHGAHLVANMDAAHVLAPSAHANVTRDGEALHVP